ncbi:hypothetical protein HDU97_004253 [Phlyctochytrium planicorne]|nr:hypothetical protein HDU97_004253 [Phlyctochytrium planicorne]
MDGILDRASFPSTQLASNQNFIISQNSTTTRTPKTTVTLHRITSHHVDSDLKFLSQLGATAYRFSISWPRILPNCTGAINQKGVDFYSHMIDQIIANGAEPYLTMYHWDLPQACQDQFGGFGDERIVDAFVEYAKVLFDKFGDRIKYWLTINEPEANCKFGWEQGIFAPGLKLGTQVGRFNCLKYTHLIHGKVVQYARQNYADKGWKFGVPSIVTYYQPASSSDADAKATDFVQQRDLGWFFDPTILGDWGEAAKTDPNEGSYVRAAAFTEEEKALIKGTADFVALNYYSTSAIRFPSGGGNGVYEGAGDPVNSYKSGSAWQAVYAPGLRALAKYTYDRYKIDVHVTEIGYTAPGEASMSLDDIVNNADRLKFWTDHIEALRGAIIEDKVPIRTFMAWAIMDNFEWIQYDSKFGCIHVDFNDPNRKRTIKNATFYMSNYFSDAKSPFPKRSLSTVTTTLPTDSQTVGTSTPTIVSTSALTTKPSSGMIVTAGWGLAVLGHVVAWVVAAVL